MSFKKIHFEISERKILLQLFDVISVLLSLYFVSIIFKFDYFSISTLNYYWTLVLTVYLVIFGHVFEMYNLQVASNQFLILKSIVLTVSTTVLVYLLTPIYTPLLPKKRIQILCFYLAILITLLVWRYFYITFLASHRFHKKVILICDTETITELIEGLEKVDPNYKVVGFIQTDLAFNEATNSLKIKQIANDDLAEFVKNNYISELVIATQKPESITVLLYNQLIHLLESGFIIREYSQVYESITQRIPVNYLA
jgi:FlaA1/EpsC-like NDP-sugar epimerase